jgi:hypothetical protein
MTQSCNSSLIWYVLHWRVLKLSLQLANSQSFDDFLLVHKVNGTLAVQAQVPPPSFQKSVWHDSMFCCKPALLTIVHYKKFLGPMCGVAWNEVQTPEGINCRALVPIQIHDHLIAFSFSPSRPNHPWVTWSSITSLDSSALALDVFVVSTHNDHLLHRFHYVLYRLGFFYLSYRHNLCSCFVCYLEAEASLPSRSKGSSVSWQHSWRTLERPMDSICKVVASIWYIYSTELSWSPSQVIIQASDVIHLNLLGTHLLVVNTPDAAVELFDKRSAIYSDRVWYFIPTCMGTFLIRRLLAQIAHGNRVVSTLSYSIYQEYSYLW